MGRSETTVRYRDLFRDREYSALFLGDLLSRLGSQLGKFALAGLVFARTGSTSFTAATFAVSYLPGLLGGPLLASLADRFPRRGLLIGSDLVRACLVVLIAVGNLPILGALGLLFLVELVKSPFGAARMAILADILDEGRFAAGNALVGASQQAIQVVGFGAGGFIVLALGARTTLLIDAATYLGSALILALVVRARRAPQRPPGSSRPRLLGDMAEGIRTVRDTPVLPPLFWLLFIGPAVLITAEALAIPYAHTLHAGDRLAGFFLAGAPLGTMLGMALVGRLAAPSRRRILGPFSLLVGVFVAGCGVFAQPYVVVACLVAAGVAMGHVAHLQASIVAAIEPHVRGRVIGLANTVLQVAQALSIVLAGVVAEATSARAVFAGAGVLGAIGVLVLFSVRSPNVGRHRAAGGRRARTAALPYAPSPATGPGPVQPAARPAAQQSIEVPAPPEPPDPELSQPDTERRQSLAARALASTRHAGL